MSKVHATLPDQASVRAEHEEWPEQEVERPTQPMDLLEPTARRDGCVLVEIGGARAGLPHRVVTTRATVGRSRTCDVSIDDDTLSRVHAHIVRDGDAWTLEDAGSRNGCYVNGQRVRRAALRGGDRIRLGSGAHLRFDLVSDEEEQALIRQYESATRDPLTGLFNRKLLDDRLAAEIAYAVRHGTELSVAMIDIDHFKRVNDSRGHLAGDAALRRVAETIVASVRIEDMVARYGGEEIVIVARGVALAGAVAMAERVRSAVARVAIAHGGHAFGVTVSIGVASLACAGPARASALIERADQRLYRAKREGRNRVVGR